ncbi:protein mono-ADP-ribosyltransferase PARP16 isoform X2 [Xenopus tropicalis]|uniref:Protein mono-ADP-ribosyltransferase PARP16 isoform X2 n=1 Tax=Xenopus tropicalis TaxID=8364 RepID=A0A8J1JB60_XENTR|nr:protein mono-ADP-ribosyltransferase PARP16 isoform X2 [Xenopus tropicalis]|eukprot:XP_017947993.1 PREDICTED: mono [ADP-ribose] polymerase PARP16 isoform X2 [Xenopus tropicalis]
MMEEIISRDLLSADLKCSLFVAALKSYKRDSVLRPFPALYTSDQYKDFEALIADSSALPGLHEIIQDKNNRDQKLLNLLSWILSEKLFTIRSVQKDKTSFFGEGTYLTSDLGLALLYSPHGQGWTRSILGPVLSCVAMCEMIDHPDVKCQAKKKDSSEIDRKRARAQNSEGGDVPQKYFVVTNNQLLRVKYLMVYSQEQPRRRSRQPTWFSKHRFAIMMTLYLFILILIGLSSSKGFIYHWNRLLGWRP